MTLHITQQILSEMESAMTSGETYWSGAISVLSSHFPEHFKKPRPVKEGKERAHAHYVSIPAGPYLLQRAFAGAIADLLHYQGCEPFQIRFDIDNTVVPRGNVPLGDDAKPARSTQTP